MYEEAFKDEPPTSGELTSRIFDSVTDAVVRSAGVLIVEVLSAAQAAPSTATAAKTVTRVAYRRNSDGCIGKAYRGRR